MSPDVLIDSAKREVVFKTPEVYFNQNIITVILIRNLKYLFYKMLED